MPAHVTLAWRIRMGVLSTIAGALFGGGSGGFASKALDLASEKMLDQDKLNDLITRIVEARLKLDIAKAQAKTIPWVDALHKMFRPMYWLLFTIAVFVFAYLGISLEAYEKYFLLASGGGGLYTLMKGRGK